MGCAPEGRKMEDGRWDIGTESNGGSPTALNPGHTPLGLRVKSDGGRSLLT
jgi:hypothetical protein